MNIISIILLAVIILVFGLIIFLRLRRGPKCGCCDGCPGCSKKERE